MYLFTIHQNNSGWPRLQQRLWLCVAPMTFCLTDLSMTLLGQTGDYWRGVYSNVTEVNPIGIALLTFHPLAFLAAGIVWMFHFGLAVTSFPYRLAKVVAMTVSVGHLAGAFTWIDRNPGDFWGTILFLAGSAVLILWSFENADRSWTPDPRVRTSATHRRIDGPVLFR